MANINELTKELLNVLSTYYDIEDIEITEQEDGSVVVFDTSSILFVCNATSDGLWNVNLEAELDDDLLDELESFDCFEEVC